MKKLFSAILFVAILLASCNNGTALQKYEKQLIEQGCNVLVKNDTANWIVWWTPDSILYLQNLNNDKQVVLFSNVDSIKCDSMYNIYTQRNEIIWFADSVDVSDDSLALVFFPPSTPEFYEMVDNPCRLVSIAELKMISIAEPEYSEYSEYHCIIRYPLWKESDIYGDLDYVIDTRLQHRLKSQKASLLRYDSDYCIEIGQTKAPYLKEKMFIRGLKAIDEVCQRISKLTDNLNPIYSDLSDMFFNSALDQLNLYMNPDYIGSFSIPDLNSWIVNVENITDDKVRYILLYGYGHNWSKAMMVNKILEDNEWFDLEKNINDLDEALSDLDEALSDDIDE